MKDQYREALDQGARAKASWSSSTSPAMPAPTATGCVPTCSPRPEIAGKLQNFVLVELYTDGTDAASDANSKLQLAKFDTVAEPYYVILDPDENVVAKFEGLTKDTAAYGAFLDQGLARATPPAQAAQSGAPEPGGGFADIKGISKVDGGGLDTSAFAGKVVLVDFWATWCVPCIKEIPGFNQLKKDYESKGLVVLGIATDEEGAERVKPFLQKHPMNYLVGLGSADLSTKFGLDELPVTIVFDRTGKQVKKFVGLTAEAEIAAAVKAAL